ncbi:MAG: SGNH/GDSL hydrolase family protein, partial [Saprospiraceae bacterium]|nr:SGNH/GDSL hydrolase family protein [Saprospiraceae bacterium]
MIESTLNRRKFTSQLVGGVTVLTMMNIPLLGKGNFMNSDDVVWRNVEEFGVEGKGWSDTKRYFDRLPSKAEGLVRQPVWDLSRHSSGMSARFVTDSPNIQVRYSLLKEGLAMPHMPATGVSGLDLYAQDDQGLDRWVSVVFPKEQIIETTIAKDLKPGSRRYTMYLPLYNGVESLEIGVDKGTYFEGLAPRSEKPILFYGTSIMHGACASRPGLAIPAILGRRLRRPTINLGFSGNGRMEGEV